VDDGYGPCLTADFGERSGFRHVSNEPIGPGSSVAPENDPIHLQWRLPLHT
jgi:hypothetical protein